MMDSEDRSESPLVGVQTSQTIRTYKYKFGKKPSTNKLALPLGL